MTTAILQYASTRSFSVFRTLATPLLLSLSVGFGASAQGLAQDCADIKAANPAATDGTYVIAPGGNPFFVHCHDMAGTPREYLTLANTGGGFNYSLWGAEVLALPTGNVVTHYTRIRIDPATLLVNTGDQTFSASVGFDCCIGPTPIVSMPYAHAASCAGTIDDGNANVDLTGLPFVVDDTFTVRGFTPTGSANGTLLPFDGAATAIQSQVVNLTGGGFCGGIGPSINGGSPIAVVGFELQLAYAGNPGIGKDTCKSGGWQSFGVFKNQGDCVSFFASRGRNGPAR